MRCVLLITCPRATEDARVKGRAPGEALASITDLVRYSFEYPADQYADAVRADIERLWREGYVELAVRNCWACPAWKGISASWQYSWERGNLDNGLYPIGADRAQRLTDQVRRSVTRPGG